MNRKHMILPWEIWHYIGEGMRECPSGERLQWCNSVLPEVSRGHSRNETSLAKQINAGRTHKRTEGLNVKVRERSAIFQGESVKPNHIRELFARG